jgi:hypothetical protein
MQCGVAEVVGLPIVERHSLCAMTDDAALAQVADWAHRRRADTQMQGLAVAQIAHAAVS